MDANNIQFTQLEIQIAKYVFKHYKDRYNSRQLGKALNINHAHASKLCNDLAKKLILKREELGNAVYFSFNYELAIAAKFIEYLLTLEELFPPKWLSLISHSLKKFNQHIIFGLIFGSAVKTHKFNDVDVLLVYDKKETNTINRIKSEIRRSMLIEQPIRYVDITEKDIILNKDDKMFYGMFSDCIILYNAQKYAGLIKKCHK